MALDVAKDNDLHEKVLAENRRVHALESSLYLERHPEQTNFFQTKILQTSLARLNAELGKPDASILDLSHEMLDALRQKIPEVMQSGFTFKVSGVEDFLELDTKNYNAVVLSALLHHLYDYESTVQKICKKLISGGCLLIFFEPLKQKVRPSLRLMSHKILARMDEWFYKRLMRLKKIPLFEEDYELSDYQRRFGGIDPNRLIELLRAQDMEIIDLDKYCSRRYGLPAYLATHLIGTENTFNVLAKKR